MKLNVITKTQNKLTNFFIYLIGPLSNILILLVTTTLWWYFPVTYFYTKDFALANFILGFFNIIPLYPLDGGNMILHSVRSSEIKFKILKIMKVACVIVGIIFLLLFIWSCFYTVNFSCFTISFFMFSSLSSYKEVINDEIKKKFENYNLKEHKVYVINYSTKYDDIKKCFDDRYYIQFYLVNNDNKVVKIFNQDEVKKLFLNHFNK